MKFNLSTPITDLSGKKFKGQSDETLTLGYFVVTALTTSHPSEINLPAPDRVYRGELAERLYEEDTADITPEDLVLIREVVGKNFGPIVVMRCFTLLG